MKIYSDDGKVFRSVASCVEYENKLKEKKEQERIRAEERMRREKLEKEKRTRYDAIMKHNDELIKEISEFEKDYGFRVFDVFFF